MSKASKEIGTLKVPEGVSRGYDLVWAIMHQDYVFTYMCPHVFIHHLCGILSLVFMVPGTKDDGRHKSLCTCETESLGGEADTPIS